MRLFLVLCLANFAAITPAEMASAGPGSNVPPPSPPVIYPGSFIADQLRKQFDRDGNGNLDPTEREQAQAWLFGRYDSNRDGRLDPRELRSLLPEQPSPAEKKAKGAAKTRPPKTREARQATQPNDDSPTETSTTSDSSTVELGQSVADALQPLDSNGDGKLDATERRKAEAYLRRLRSQGSSTPKPQSKATRPTVDDATSDSTR